MRAERGHIWLYATRGRPIPQTWLDRLLRRQRYKLRLVAEFPNGRRQTVAESKR